MTASSGSRIDNLVQLLLIDALCRGVLGFPADLVYGRILPGAAISILVGNLAYALPGASGWRSAPGGPTSARCPTASTRSRCSRTCSSSCCRPRRWRSRRARRTRRAWRGRPGLFATLASGVIELACAPIAERLRKATPRAALLSTLAGIALSFISLGFLFRTFARPIVGLTTLAIVMLTYFGRVRFKGRIPGGVLAVAIGTLLAWLTGIAPVGARPEGAALHLPIPVVGDLFAALARRPPAGRTSR